jgi:aspartyl-tRNA(Asn)/glutamyl-tRNA(Gln) amidotransferase subunit C
MSLLQSDVEKIAKLSRLALTDAENEQILNQLNNIFTLIEKMQSVDTTGVEPMSHPQEVPLRLREDVVTEVNQRDYFQKQAPQVQDGLFLVPKVIES